MRSKKSDKSMKVKTEHEEIVISDNNCHHCNNNYFCKDDHECLSCGVNRDQKIKPYKGW